jgi:hypothetical protein
MTNQNYTTTLLVDQKPAEVFKAVTNVRGWWSQEIEGGTEKTNDEFTYRYNDVHNCKMKLLEVVADKKVLWLVLDNYFNFTTDKNEWKGTKVEFDISKQGDKTQLRFTHIGLVPSYECYSACTNGWNQYIRKSLLSLITTGKGQPNASRVTYTTHEVASRFSELARQEKWFEIQDELFAEDVKSIEPPSAIHLQNAEGKEAVRKKGEDWVKRIEALHSAHTTQPIVAGNFFCVGREKEMTVREIGRIEIKQIMMYEVRNGKIISERFFY